MKFMSLNWDDFRIFLDVARTGNLSQSAQRLRIDHSTASRRISQLETALGFALFARSRTGFQLNEVGNRLLIRAEMIESAVIAIQTDIGSTTDEVVGTVRLATMEGIASLYLAPRMLLFRQAAPNVTLELVTSPQVIHVNRREADLFLSFFMPSGQGLVSTLIGKFHLYLFASAGYLERKGCPKTVGELQDHDFVSYIDDRIYVDAVRWLDDIIRKPNLVFRSNSMIAQLAAAIGGVGLVLLPRFAVDARSPLIPVMHEAVSTTRELWLNVHQDLQYVARIRAVVRFLDASMKADMAAGLL